MSNIQVEDVIIAAKHACKNKGRGLTRHRQRILEILINADKPMSAYELKDSYNLTEQSPMVAMSVYRILEFLESAKLVHRLKSANRYIACNSLSGVCEHETSVYLICKSCQKIEELRATEHCIQPLQEKIEANGFASRDSHIEVATICKTCKQ